MTATERRAFHKATLCFGIHFTHIFGYMIQKGTPPLQQQPKMELDRLMNALNRFTGFLSRSMPEGDWKASVDFTDDATEIFEKFLVVGDEGRKKIMEFVKSIPENEKTL